MTGNGDAARRERGDALVRCPLRVMRYVAVDGGAGAQLLAALPGCSPYLRPVPSPRHADLLIVVEPVGRKLVPSEVEVARALPRPARALLVETPGASRLWGAAVVPTRDLLGGARTVSLETDRSTSLQSERVAGVALEPGPWPEMHLAEGPEFEPARIPLLPKREMEMATEPAVLSLGPIQPFTAGPLRILLVCDGEQVQTATVEAGYAHRGVSEAMCRADWRRAADVARHLDPIAPVAGRLAFVRALEKLQGRRPPRAVEGLQDAALALERAENRLWWLARFAEVLAESRLASPARDLALAVARLSEGTWERPLGEWLAPQAGGSGADRGSISGLRTIAGEVDALRRQVEHDRLLALRTRGIGVVKVGTLESLGQPERHPRGEATPAGVAGPVLRASERGEGDVRSRLLTRLEMAVADLRGAAERLVGAAEAPERPARWDAPPGTAEVAVEGPRGAIGLRLVSEGGEGPARVEWRSPSAALLPLLPEMLADQKLADAEIIVASLDLATAEADG